MINTVKEASLLLALLIALALAVSTYRVAFMDRASVRASRTAVPFTPAQVAPDSMYSDAVPARTIGSEVRRVYAIGETSIKTTCGGRILSIKTDDDSLSVVFNPVSGMIDAWVAQVGGERYFQFIGLEPMDITDIDLSRYSQFRDSTNAGLRPRVNDYAGQRVKYQVIMAIERELSSPNCFLKLVP